MAQKKVIIPLIDAATAWVRDNPSEVVNGITYYHPYGWRRWIRRTEMFPTTFLLGSSETKRRKKKNVTDVLGKELVARIYAAFMGCPVFFDETTDQFMVIIPKESIGCEMDKFKVGAVCAMNFVEMLYDRTQRCRSRQT